MIIQQESQSKFLSTAEYRRLPFLNYSGIKCFDESRNKFYRQYILKEVFEEEKSSAMIFGDLVDCLLFSPEDFDKKFAMLSVGNAPTGQMKIFVDNLWKLTKECLDEGGVITRTIEALFEEAFNATKYDKSGEAVNFKGKDLSYVIKSFEGAPHTYYQMCRDNFGKTVIDTRTRESAERIVQELHVNPVTADVLSIRDGKTHKVFKQLPITFKYGQHELKALLDLMIINLAEKKIYVYDLKSSGWDIGNFEYNILKNKYYLQWTVYYLAVEAWAESNYFKDFEIVPMQFIVVSADMNENPLIYTTSKRDLNAGKIGFTLKNSRQYKGLDKLLMELNWHQAYGIWNMSYDDYQSNGVRAVKIFDE